MRALAANAYQIEYLIFEIERSANVGIGYAFPVDPIVDDIHNIERWIE